MSAALQWIVGSDTGMSSKALWSHMMNGTSSGAYPLDVDDFGRIVRLLDLMPEWRPRVVEMVRYSAEWAALWSAWEELEGMYRAWWAHPERQSFRHPNDSHALWEAFHQRYKALMDEHVRCAGCNAPLRGSWRSTERGRVCWSCERAAKQNAARAARPEGPSNV